MPGSTAGCAARSGASRPISAGSTATSAARSPAIRTCSYEFDAKVGIAATNREDFILAAKAFDGTPYDGHTL
jgi:hypothetical protein